MSSENLTSLRAEYEAAYVFPFTRYSWKSQRGRLCWIDLEGWQDALAGPICSVIKGGDCAYVYARDDEYFAEVKDPDALYARLQQWHSKLIAGLDRFVPAVQTEQADLAAMQEFARKMWVLAEKAIEIERSRWTP